MYLPIALLFGASIATAGNVPETSNANSETHLPMKLHSQIRANVGQSAPLHTKIAPPQSQPVPAVKAAIPQAPAGSLAAALTSPDHASIQPAPITHHYNTGAQYKPQAYLFSAPAKSGISALLANAFTGLTNKFGRRSGKTSPLDSALYNLNAIPESAGNGLDLNNIQALNDMIGSALNSYAAGALPGAQATPTPAQVGLMNTISSFVTNNLSKGKKIFDIPKSFYKSLGERIIGTSEANQAPVSSPSSVASVPLKDSIVSTIKSALSYLKPARSSSASSSSVSSVPVDSGNLKRRISDPFYAQNQQWAQTFYNQLTPAQQAQLGNFQIPSAQQQQLQPQQTVQQQVSESQRQPQFVAQPDGSFASFGYGNANELTLNPAQNGYPQSIQGYPQYVQQPPVHKSSFYKKSKNWISHKLTRKHKNPQGHPLRTEQFGQTAQQFYPQQQQQQIQGQQQTQQQSQLSPVQQVTQNQQPTFSQNILQPKSQLPTQTMNKVQQKLSSLPGLFNQKTQPQQQQQEQQFIPLQPQQQQTQQAVDIQPSEQQFSAWNSPVSSQQASNLGSFTSFFTQQPPNTLFTGFQNYPSGQQGSMFNGPQVAGTVASSTVSPFATSTSMSMNVEHHSSMDGHEHIPDEHSVDQSGHDQGLYFFDQSHHHAAAESVHHEEAVKPDTPAAQSNTAQASSQIQSTSQVQQQQQPQQHQQHAQSDSSSNTAQSS